MLVNGIPFYKIGTFGKIPDSYITVELYEEFKSTYNFPNKGDIPNLSFRHYWTTCNL